MSARIHCAESRLLLDGVVITAYVIGICFALISLLMLTLLAMMLGSGNPQPKEVVFALATGITFALSGLALGTVRSQPNGRVISCELTVAAMGAALFTAVYMVYFALSVQH